MLARAFIINRLRAIWPKGYQRGSLRKKRNEARKRLIIKALASKRQNITTKLLLTALALLFVVKLFLRPVFMLQRLIRNYQIYLWCSVNRLLVNPTKTNITINTPKQTVVQTLHLNSTSNGSPVNIVSSAKYLEVITDSDFNFKDHITGLERRVARSVGILSNLVHIFPQNIVLQLYHA